MILVHSFSLAETNLQNRDTMKATGLDDLQGKVDIIPKCFLTISFYKDISYVICVSDCASIISRVTLLNIKYDQFCGFWSQNSGTDGFYPDSYKQVNEENQ